MSTRYPPVRGDVSFLRDPDLPGLEIRTSRYDAAAFPKHTHPGYSVGFVEAGGSRVFLRGRMGRLQRGAAVLIHPEEVHACNPEPGSSWAYRMFYIDRDFMAALAASVSESDGPVVEPVFAQVAVDDARLVADLRALHEAVAREASVLVKETLALSCIAGLLSRHAGGPEGPGSKARPESRTVRLAQEWLHAHWADTVRLADLANATNRSEYAVLRAFQRATGLTPHAYQVQLRMAKAREMLAAGRSIAEVAAETGHTDQSHFTNVFRAHAGATPGQYQRGC
ncbi:AraC family transcriptional regulator [Oceanidesulfovibrio indonesiensis]|uniref:AraC family transcriptional regulator n=1 Tax=Oceanidesulfovibrio indonesiensis TaxID=54767 RepID=A0A7M3ME02_9BACT|nr:AraC family transcriptional regulator [Oceanidesulfovibrio indonesiensis]TVM16397.1 AraC family transcriptional regulator [Oceanidesulfovibrio indonesiensis]